MIPVLEMLPSSAVAATFLAFFAGACLGSFLFAVRTRCLDPLSATADPIGAVFGRSVCHACARTLHPRELVPIVSWILQRGRCGCGVKIPAAYLRWEIAVGATMALAFAGSAVPMTGAFLAALLWTLTVASAVDLRLQILPDALTIFVAALGFAAAAVSAIDASLRHAIEGALLGAAMLWLPRQGWLWFKNVEGLGLGDVKLGFAGGAWLGFAGIPWALIVACAVTAGWIIFRHVRTGDALRLRYPFGPGLAAGISIVAVAQNAPMLAG